MLVIRLFRVGKKNQPSFKIVVTDKRNPTHAGRFVEEVGFYNLITKEKVLKPERIKYWLSVGAKPSDTVFNFFVSEKIMEGKKIAVQKKSKKPAEPAAAPAPASAPESASADKPAASKPEAPKEQVPPVSEKPAEKEPEAKTEQK